MNLVIDDAEASCGLFCFTWIIAGQLRTHVAKKTRFVQEDHGQKEDTPGDWPATKLLPQQSTAEVVKRFYDRSTAGRILLKGDNICLMMNTGA